MDGIDHNYTDMPITDYELRSLSALAISEETNFFNRRPHLIETYGQRLILIALCQGAALWYLGGGDGVKDFDIHFFYAQNPDKKQLSRRVKRIYERVGHFPRKPIDFVRTVVPNTTPHLSCAETLQTIKQFLEKKPTITACHLSKKAVIALWPDEVFATQIWPTDIS